MSDSSYYCFNYQYYPLYAQGPGPLPGQTPSNQQQPCLAGGVNSSGAEVSIAVRVVNPEKKESKVFKLRSICTKDITTPQQLRDELFTQFGDEIVSDSCDFAVGYFRGQQKLWIRTAEDLEEAWSLVSTGRGTLWCDGVNFAKKSYLQMRKTVDKMQGKNLELHLQMKVNNRGLKIIIISRNSCRPSMAVSILPCSTDFGQKWWQLGRIHHVICHHECQCLLVGEQRVSLQPQT